VRSGHGYDDDIQSLMQAWSQLGAGRD
jgi:hypothetical protein